MVALVTGRLAAVQPSAEQARYPLAHRTGIVLFEQLLASSMAWDRCTSAQRALLAETGRGLRARAEGSALVDPPELPETVQTRTLTSLREKGLVEVGNRRLTQLGALAAANGPDLDSRRST